MSHKLEILSHWTNPSRADMLYALDHGCDNPQHHQSFAFLADNGNMGIVKIVIFSLNQCDRFSRDKFAFEGSALFSEDGDQQHIKGKYDCSQRTGFLIVIE